MTEAEKKVLRWCKVREEPYYLNLDQLEQFYPRVSRSEMQNLYSKFYVVDKARSQATGIHFITHGGVKASYLVAVYVCEDPGTEKLPAVPDYNHFQAYVEKSYYENFGNLEDSTADDAETGRKKFQADLLRTHGRGSASYTLLEMVFPHLNPSLEGIHSRVEKEMAKLVRYGIIAAPEQVRPEEPENVDVRAETQ